MSTHTAPESEDPVRVVVADDQDIVRDGLVTVLSLIDGIEVVGAARNGQEALDLVATHQPDGRADGSADARAGRRGGDRRLRSEHPEVAVLVLTTFDDDASIAAALRRRRARLPDQGRLPDDIAVAIRTVARGQSTFTATVTDRLLDGLGRARSGPSASPAAARWADRSGSGRCSV